jgi:hypothetical protein
MYVRVDVTYVVTKPNERYTCYTLRTYIGLSRRAAFSVACRSLPAADRTRVSCKKVVVIVIIMLCRPPLCITYPSGICVCPRGKERTLDAVCRCSSRIILPENIADGRGVKIFLGIFYPRYSYPRLSQPPIRLS